MTRNLSKLKRFEKKIDRIIEDPERAIWIVSRSIDMGCCEDPPVPENKKITFYEFVKYFGNYQVDEAIENGRDVEKHIKESQIVEIENRIREIGGFSDETLPEGTVIKYR